MQTMCKRLHRSLEEIAQLWQEQSDEPVDQWQKINAKLRARNQYSRPVLRTTSDLSGIPKFYPGLEALFRAAAGVRAPIIYRTVWCKKDKTF